VTAAKNEVTDGPNPAREVDTKQTLDSLIEVVQAAVQRRIGFGSGLLDGTSL
jgi:hypothetical protein